MSDEIRTTGVQVVLGPRGITLDRDGRISFSDPEILEAMVMAGPGRLAGETAFNLQCGTANNFKCGVK